MGEAALALESDDHVSLDFALGMEWALFRARLLKNNDAFTWTSHLSNTARLIALAAKQGRGCQARRIERGPMVELQVSGVRVREA